MTQHRSEYARILRRETHSPRSGAAITIAVVIILLLIWIATEAVLVVTNLPSLILAPTAILTALVTTSKIAAPVLIVAGIVIGLVGLFLIVLSLLPGTRARHRLPSQRYAVLVDDNVIARAIARRVSVENALEPEQITVYLGHRSVVVRVTPSSGLPLDRAEIRETISEELASYDLRLRAKLVVTAQGALN